MAADSADTPATVSPLPTAAPGAVSQTAEAAAVRRARTQAAWFAQHATRSRIGYVTIKLAQIVSGALVPFAASVQTANAGWVAVTAALGVVIVVLEGVQQLFQFHTNWYRYRSANIALASQLALFTAGAGEYGAAPNPAALFAQRTEGVVMSENSSWMMTDKGSTGAPAEPQAKGA
ncbi:hypothetical protein GCM10027449_02280 [Sinomonas notoginsengisoli]|uniref:DUF4231 domain-containing protein n=1 Tax=Sinomonas notoginsengisoli TaxID=1457311 RepID=UPI001F28CF89|nr:DUF4231 domain-containing protein [Sinomonas notoginsengisoli]